MAPSIKGPCQVGNYAAWEAGKYLAKALDQVTAGETGPAVVKRVKNLMRSKSRPKFVKEKKPHEACGECGDSHKTTFVGRAKKLTEEYPRLTDEVRDVAYHPIGGSPWECWINAVCVGSKAFAGESYELKDMLVALPEPCS